MKKIVTTGFLFFAMCAFAFAGTQQKTKSTKDEYKKVVTGRADKIVKKMSFDNDETKTKVRDHIVGFYCDLNAIQDARDVRIKSVKNNAKTKKEKKEKQLKEKAGKKCEKVRDKFVAGLSKLISEEQIGQVKDGLTYGVAPKTFVAYKEMIPSLTEIQKAKIWEWLKEAREHAVIGGSSKEKHWWFGKYKGRINNYLSAEGYNIQAERKAWEERIKAQKK